MAEPQASRPPTSSATHALRVRRWLIIITFFVVLGLGIWTVMIPEIRDNDPSTTMQTKPS